MKGDDRGGGVVPGDVRVGGGGSCPRGCPANHKKQANVYYVWCLRTYSGATVCISGYTLNKETTLAAFGDA